MAHVTAIGWTIVLCKAKLLQDNPIVINEILIAMFLNHESISTLLPNVDQDSPKLSSCNHHTRASKDVRPYHQRSCQAQLVSTWAWQNCINKVRWHWVVKTCVQRHIIWKKSPCSTNKWFKREPSDADFLSFVPVIVYKFLCLHKHHWEACCILITGHSAHVSKTFKTYIRHIHSASPHGMIGTLPQCNQRKVWWAIQIWSFFERHVIQLSFPQLLLHNSALVRELQWISNWCDQIVVSSNFVTCSTKRNVFFPMCSFGGPFQAPTLHTTKQPLCKGPTWHSLPFGLEMSDMLC